MLSAGRGGWLDGLGYQCRVQLLARSISDAVAGACGSPVLPVLCWCSCCAAGHFREMGQPAYNYASSQQVRACGVRVALMWLTTAMWC